LQDLGEDKKLSPLKTAKAQPDKLKPPSKQPDSASAPKRDESKGAGGLRAPSRLVKPSPASSNLNATEQRKQRVLEKQKAVNAKLEEKAKQTSTAGPRPATSRASAAKESGAATSRWTAAKSKVLGAVKAGEETKTIGGRRSSLGGAGAVTSRVGASGRFSARPGAKDGAEGSPKRTAAGQAEPTSATTRVRGTSANKDKDL